jgi:hypothetical protein
MLSSKKLDEMLIKEQSLAKQAIENKDVITALSKRLIEVEDAIAKNIGVKVRIVNNVTMSKFTKLELCIISAALQKMSQTTKTMDDTKFVMDLYNKVVELTKAVEE